MIRNIKNVLWDLDGTLTDPAEGIVNSIRFALEKLGFPSPSTEDLHKHIGPPLHLAFEAILGAKHKGNVQQALDLYRQRYSRDGMGMIENKIYHGISETLAKIKKLGIKQFVATSKPTPITRQITAHFKLNDYFDEIYGSELDGTRSNKGDLIAYILKKENLNPDETIMIGDRKHDIIGGLAHGVKGIGACWGYGSEEELKTAGASYLIQHPKELLNGC